MRLLTDPVVVWRPCYHRWFVVFPDDGMELAPVFDSWTTAAEIAGKYQDGHAFFTDIPTIEIDTPYPRPNRMQPARTIDLRRFLPADHDSRQRRRSEFL